jgi:glycosyltransferase involved in cell wall biosynthesis
MRFSNQNHLRQEIEMIGWRSLDERFWTRLNTVHPKIVIIAPPLDTVPSPMGNAIYTIIQEMASELPEPTLILARWSENDRPFECEISDRILYDTNPLRAGWLEARTPFRLKRLLYGSGAPFYFNYARRAAQLCRRLNAEVIIIEDIPIFASIVRKNTLVSQSIFLHQHINAPRSVPHGFWLQVMESLAGIIFVADATWEETESLHGNLPIPAKVIYNGVDLTKYDPQVWQKQAYLQRNTFGIADDDKVFLYVGRIAPNKGIAEAVEAFISASIEKCHFVVVGNLDESWFGSVSYTERLRRAAANSNGNVHLVGCVSQTEIPGYYAMADIVIVPSLGHEGLPKVITEALAMLVPCIVTRRGGALELIQDGENGWVVPNPVDISSLEDTIRRAFKECENVNVSNDCRAAVSSCKMITQFAEFIALPLARTTLESI